MQIDFDNETVGAYISRVLPTTKLCDLDRSQLAHLAELIQEDAERDRKHAEELEKFAELRRRKNLKVN